MAESSTPPTDPKGVFVSWDEAKARHYNSKRPLYASVSTGTIDLVIPHTSTWETLPLTELIGFPLKFKSIDDRTWLGTTVPLLNKTASTLKLDVKGWVHRKFGWLNGHTIFARCDGEDLSIKDMKAVESFFVKVIWGHQDSDVVIPRLGPDESQFESAVKEATYETAFALFDASAFSAFRQQYVEEEKPMRQRCYGCKLPENESTEDSTGPDLRKCTKCRVAAYCSKTCQEQHWPEHKEICKHYARLRRQGVRFEEAV